MTEGGSQLSNTSSICEIDSRIYKQTHPSPKPIQEYLCGDRKRVTAEEDPLLTVAETRLQESNKPLPLRSLLTRDVLVASANYWFLSLVKISFRALQPIFLSTPIELGGLGLDPPMIRTIMGSFGILNGVISVFLFSRMTDYLGVKAVYLMGVTAAVPCFSLFPVINYLAYSSIAHTGNLGTEVWIAVEAQVVLSVFVALAFGMFISERLKLLSISLINVAWVVYITGAVFIFIAAASPNRASLGATNGLAQLSVSIMRAIGPAVVSSVYSLSINKEHHYMNGGLVYYVTVVLSLGAIWVGSLLPKRPFKHMK